MITHYASINENNIVINVIVVPIEALYDEDQNEIEELGAKYCSQLQEGTWLRVYENNTPRKNRAGIGYTYDPDRDAFISPRPSEEYLFNEETCRWYLPQIENNV